MQGVEQNETSSRENGPLTACNELNLLNLFDLFDLFDLIGRMGIVKKSKRKE